jgi:hypothetical protein
VLLPQVTEPSVTASTIPLPQLAACALLSCIVIAWSIHLARRKGRWLMAVGPLAAAALFGALTQWPRAEPAASQPVQPLREEKDATAAPTEPALLGETGLRDRALAADAPTPPLASEPLSLGPPPTVVLRGRWTPEDSTVVASVMAQALARVPAAGGAVLEVVGAGRSMRPTAGGIQQYAVTATWTLRPAPGAGVLAGSGLGEVLGLGATLDQARRGAAANAARAIASALNATLPAPRSAAGDQQPSF